MAVSSHGENPKLDAPYGVDWRGVPLRTVLDAVAHESGVTCLIDRSVRPEVLDERLRLFAGHLTGRQALRWAARLAGVEAVFREDIALIADRKQLPRVWRLTGGGTDEAKEMERLQQISNRHANIAWIDTPLSAVARSVSSELGIDVIFHPQLVADEGLVHLEDGQATLDAIRAALEEQLKAKTAIFDGALWVTPASLEQEEPASQPSQPDSRPGGRKKPPGIGPLEQFVVIDRSVKSWADFSERISRASGLSCSILPSSASWMSPLEARGTVGDVLESTQLLGKLTWRLLPGPGRTATGLEIRPGKSGH